MLYIEELTGSSIRNLKKFHIKTNESLNFFYGENASGKTSILEGIFLLSRLKSFRSKRIGDVVTRGDSSLLVSAKGRKKSKVFSVGVEKGRGLTRVKFNNKQVKTTRCLLKNTPPVQIQGS